MVDDSPIHTTRRAMNDVVDIEGNTGERLVPPYARGSVCLSDSLYTALRFIREVVDDAIHDVVYDVAGREYPGERPPPSMVS